MCESDDNNQMVGVEMARLVEATLVDLRFRVDFLAEYWTRDSEEDKAVYSWVILLGVLVHDVGSSIIPLTSARRLRSAKILLRSLFEYYLALASYSIDSAKALREANDAPTALQKYFDGNKARGLRIDFTAEEEIAFRKFMLDNQGRITRRIIQSDTQLVYGRDSDRGKFEYCSEYAYMSSFAHGGPLAFADVFTVSDNEQIRIHWTTLNLKDSHILCDAAYRLVHILQVIEELSGYFSAWKVHASRYDSIMENWNRSSAQR